MSSIVLLRAFPTGRRREAPWGRALLAPTGQPLETTRLCYFRSPQDRELWLGQIVPFRRTQRSLKRRHRSPLLAAHKSNLFLRPVFLGQLDACHEPATRYIPAPPVGARQRARALPCHHPFHRGLSCPDQADAARLEKLISRSIHGRFGQAEFCSPTKPIAPALFD